MDARSPLRRPGSRTSISFKYRKNFLSIVITSSILFGFSEEISIRKFLTVVSVINEKSGFP